MSDEILRGVDADAVYRMDREHVWHALAPHTQTDAFVAVSGDGCYVKDLNGRTYFDGMSGLWCVNVGYGREEIAKAAYEQLTALPFYPLSAGHVPAALLADKLSDWLGGDYRTFFSNSGSEANETALKIARQYHAQRGESTRYKVVSRYRAYHGSTMGALSATGQQQRKFRYEPLVPGFLHVHPPDCYRCPFGRTPDSCGLLCAEEFDRAITWEGPETVAAVILEPVITGGGMLTPPADYLPRVEEICRKHGVLMIVDEVISGYGRSGKNFGFQHFGVTPDIVTSAKGITSGYLPLAATSVRREIFECAFTDRDDPYHFLRQVSTFGGHPVSCAAALANLDIMKREGLADNASVMGRRLADRLEELRSHPLVGDIRTFGLLAGIELVSDREQKTPAEISVVNHVVEAAKARGVIVGKNGVTVAGFNNVVTLAPPLIVLEDEIDMIVRVLEQSLEEGLASL